MDAKDALRISREVAKSVRDAVKDVPVRERGKNVGMGKDGTPTKLIDKVAEDAAFEVLKSYNVTVVSEEAGEVGGGEIFVALDPLDGTFNASRGVPIYSVSLCFSSSRMLSDAFFGYVYNLATGDEYYADEKAYKNGEEIEVSKTERVEDCNAIIYYPHIRYPFKRMRVFGSAALEMCMVADGSFDCFIDLRDNGGRGMLRIYDVAAGIYIAKRAGCEITDTSGKDLGTKKFTMEERLKVLAANKTLHRKILELLS